MKSTKMLLTCELVADYLGKLNVGDYILTAFCKRWPAGMEVTRENLMADGVAFEVLSHTLNAAHEQTFQTACQLARNHYCATTKRPWNKSHATFMKMAKMGNGRAAMACMDKYNEETQQAHWQLETDLVDALLNVLGLLESHA